MLYKKIHRQHVRKWRIGRKFEWFGCVFVVAREPHIGKFHISVKVNGGYSNHERKLIRLKGRKGTMEHTDIVWLED